MAKKSRPLFFWRKLRFIYLVIITGVSGPISLLLHYPKLFINSLAILSFFCIVTLFFIIHPSSRHKLGTGKRLSTWQYIVAIALLELIVFSLLSMISVSFSQYPTATPSQANYFSILHCLFPWSLFAIAAMLSGRYYYDHHQHCGIASTISTLKNTYFDMLIKRVFFIVSSITSQMVHVYCIVAFILYALLVFSRNNHTLPPSGITVELAVATILCLGFFVSKEGKELFDWLNQRVKISIGNMYLLSSVFLLIIFIFAAAFHTEPILKLKITPIDSQTLSQFYYACGLALTPAVSGMIVYLSRGYSIRFMLCLVIIFPALATILFATHPNYLAIVNQAKWFASIGLLGLWLVLFKSKNNQWFISALNAIPKDQNLAILAPTKKTTKSVFLSMATITLFCLIGTPANIITFTIAIMPLMLVPYIWGVVHYVIRFHSERS